MAMPYCDSAREIVAEKRLIVANMETIAMADDKSRVM